MADVPFGIGSSLLPLEWFVSKPCPLCRQPLPPPGLVNRLCSRCSEALMLPCGGLHGSSPLCWWAAGPYAGAFRRLLLTLRQRPHPPSIAALLRHLQPPDWPADVSPILVAVPGWKRKANPLPELICRTGGREWRWNRADLLQRSRPVLGQHHLNRAMRLDNQRGAFTCQRRPGPFEARRHPVLLVDDILTTGATALSAATALGQAGWQVKGVICLARTPRAGSAPQQR